MGGKIVLNTDERPLYDALCKLVEQTKKFYTGNAQDNDEQRKRYAEMGNKADSLYQSLKNRGFEPRSHKYMYRNRKVPVYEIEFNDPLDPIADLIAFINNPEGNRDNRDVQNWPTQVV